MSAPHDFERSRPVSAKEASQGETGHNARYVLLISTLGGAIVVAAVLIWAFGFG